MFMYLCFFAFGDWTNVQKITIVQLDNKGVGGMGTTFQKRPNFGLSGDELVNITCSTKGLNGQGTRR